MGRQLGGRWGGGGGKGVEVVAGKEQTTGLQPQGKRRDEVQMSTTQHPSLSLAVLNTTHCLIIIITHLDFKSVRILICTLM